jgi:hypothetical protein
MRGLISQVVDSHGEEAKSSKHNQKFALPMLNREEAT